MGKKLDMLLGRSFKAAKFKPLIALSISRLAVLKNQRQARFKVARSDVVEILQLGQHERALLRVEHVIKEQNMLDVYDLIERYCNLLVERVHLIEQERECPEELREAASGLLYAASRCGDFPELQEIRAVLTTRFGKELAGRAIELRNNCGVSPQIVQKLSTRMPGLENRMKVLKEIASENSIVLQLECASVSVEVETNIQKQNEPKFGINIEESLHVLPEKEKDDEHSGSFKARQKYKGVADAAQAAFESAAYAAAAARAAVELSRSESHDPDDQDSPSPGLRNSRGKGILSVNEGEELNKNAEELEKKPKSAGEILKESTSSVDELGEADPLEKKPDFDESENDNDNEQNTSQVTSRFHAPQEVDARDLRLPIVNAVAGSKMQSTPHLGLEKKPFSVRTRGVRGY
ncbi:hypothetical protein L6164_001762 [Bauhinia variegata]|uniref:Uncharacterized protein n=1 Tax=Bauhinia variegata TaxID=167791 RepID=A0ACB9Q9S7_BAUVA|nr:hypothetical protein L6164_001762 [Bauhinia variegata]